MKPWLHSWRLVVAVVGAAAAGWIAAGWRPGTDRSGRPALEAGPVKPVPIMATGIGRYEADFAAVAAAGNPAAQMAAAVALAGRIDPADFAGFLENLRLLPAHSAQGLASRTVLRRWVAHDPAAALRWCAKHDRDMIDGVLDEWVCVTAPERLGSLLEEIPFKYRAQAVPSLFAALAKNDPEAAVTLLAREGVPYPELRLGTAFHELARQDPHWLVARAEGLSEQVRDLARMQAAKALTETARDDGLAWVMGQPDRSRLLGGLADDPALIPSLLAVIAGLPQDEQATVHFSLHNLGTSGAREFLDALNAQQTRLAEPFVRNLLANASHNLAQTEDPASLANRLLATEVGKLWDMAAFASSWGDRSPDAARAWASGLSDESQRRKALEAVAGVTLPENGTERMSLADRLAERLSQGHVNEPHQLLALTDDERRQVLEDGFSRALNNENSHLLNLADRYPAEAARAVASALTAENTDSLLRPLTAAATQWAAVDPQAAAQWATTLPPGESRAWAAANVVEQWRFVDEPAARAWIESLPPDERDTAATALRNAGQ